MRIKNFTVDIDRKEEGFIVVIRNTISGEIWTPDPIEKISGVVGFVDKILLWAGEIYEHRNNEERKAIREKLRVYAEKLDENFKSYHCLNSDERAACMNGQSFIEDIFENGLTNEVIARNRSIFPETTLLISKRRKQIAANAFHICFDAEKDDKGGHIGGGKFIYYSTAASFPDDDILSILAMESFAKKVVIEKNGDNPKEKHKEHSK